MNKILITLYLLFCTVFMMYADAQNAKLIGHYKKPIDATIVEEKIINMTADKSGRYTMLINRTLAGLISDTYEYWVITEKQTQGPFDFAEVGGYLLDGSKLVFRSKVADKSYIHIGNVRLGPYLEPVDEEGNPQPGQFILSVSGAGFLYKAALEDGQYLIHNGRELGPFKEVSYYGFMPDQVSIYYAYKDEDGKSFLKLGNKTIGEESSIEPEGEPVFSSDRKHWAFRAKMEKEAWVITDTGKLGPYEETLEPLLFSPDSQSIAFTVKEKDLWFVQHKDRKYGPFEETGSMKFSPDSQVIAFTAKQDKNWFLHANDGIAGPYEETGHFAFSGNSRALTYCAKTNGNWYLIVNREKKGPFENVGFISYSPDNSRFAWAYAENGKWKIIKGDRLYGNLDSIGSLCFLDDNKTLVYTASIAQEWYLGIDAIRIGPFTNIKVKQAINPDTISLMIDGAGFLYHDDVVTPGSIFSDLGKEYGYVYYQDGSIFMNTF